MNIDRTRIYKVGDYSFHNFTTLDDEMIEKVRVWRNHLKIRKYMYNSKEISEMEHLAFIGSLACKKDRSYWLVKKYESPVGVVNIVDIDNYTFSGQTGFYLFPDFIGSGIGLEFMGIIHYFIFHELGFKRTFGRINTGNKNSLMLNYILGFKFRPETIEIDGENYIEIDGNREEYLNRYPSMLNKESIQKSYKEFRKTYKQIRK